MPDSRKARVPIRIKAMAGRLVTAPVLEEMEKWGKIKIRN